MGSALSEDYDLQGVLAKIGQSFAFVQPAFPGVFEATNAIYDTKGSGYCLLALVTADHPAERIAATVSPAWPVSFFSPNTIAAEAAR